MVADSGVFDTLPRSRGRGVIQKKTREFVRSFFLPRGGTEHPPGTGSPLYAGRFDGQPALFVHAWYNPLAVQDPAGDGHPDGWVPWIVPRTPDPSAKAWHSLVVEQLERLGYVNTHAGWTILVQREPVECDVFLKAGDAR
jgi:hypothetical protein